MPMNTIIKFVDMNKRDFVKMFDFSTMKVKRWYCGWIRLVRIIIVKKRTIIFRYHSAEAVNEKFRITMKHLGKIFSVLNLNTVVSISIFDVKPYRFIFPLEKSINWILGDKTSTEICSISLTRENIDSFSYAIKNHYWYQMFIDDLPIWGWSKWICTDLIPNEV